jgi:hypothetical protein
MSRSVEVVVDDRSKLVLQIPADLLGSVLDLSGPQSEIRDAMTQPWSVIYREAGVPTTPLVLASVFGFADKEALGTWMEKNYRSIDVLAVLRNGRPVKFDMRVSARIG